MSDVRCILYKQVEFPSGVDVVHGFKYSIFEIQIPSMKLFFNHAGIFPIHLGRYKNAEKLRVFYISFESASFLKQALESTKTASKLANDLLQARAKEFEGRNTVFPQHNKDRRY